MSKNLTFKFII